MRVEGSRWYAGDEDICNRAFCRTGDGSVVGREFADDDRVLWRAERRPVSKIS